MAAPTSFAPRNARPKRVTYKKQKALALALVNKEGANLRLLPPKFRNDKEIVLAALSQDLHALDFIDLYSEDALSCEIIPSFDFNEINLEGQTILTEALAKKRYKLAENLILCGAKLSLENMKSIKKLDPESEKCQNIRAAIAVQRNQMGME